MVLSSRYAGLLAGGPEAFAECSLVVRFLLVLVIPGSYTIPIRTARVTTCTRHTHPFVFRSPTASEKEKKDNVSHGTGTENRQKRKTKREKRLQLRLTEYKLAAPGARNCRSRGCEENKRET